MGLVHIPDLVEECDTAIRLKNILQGISTIFEKKTVTLFIGFRIFLQYRPNKILITFKILLDPNVRDDSILVFDSDRIDRPLVAGFIIRYILSHSECFITDKEV